MAFPYHVTALERAGGCCGEYDWNLPTFTIDVIEHKQNESPTFPNEFRHLDGGGKNAKMVQTPYPFLMPLA